MEEDDNFLNSVKSLRIQIREIVKTDKLMKHIVKRSLDPILEVLENIYLNVLSEAGRMVVEVLKENVAERLETSRTYLIVEFNPDVEPYTPGGGRYVEKDSHDASSPLSSPASMTGTLLDSIGFNITKAGVLKVGQVNLTTGGWSVDKSELKTVFFRGNKIFVNDEIGKATSVGRYAQYLEEGTGPWTTPDGIYSRGGMAARPWISETIKEMQSAIKEFIKEQIHTAIKRRTRSEGVRKAFTFNVFIARR